MRGARRSPRSRTGGASPISAGSPRTTVPGMGSRRHRPCGCRPAHTGLAPPTTNRAGQRLSWTRRGRLRGRRPRSPSTLAAWRRCTCQECRPGRSRGVVVFVDDAAEAVVSVVVQVNQSIRVGDRFGQRGEWSGVGGARYRASGSGPADLRISMVDRTWQNRNRVFAVQGPVLTVTPVRRRGGGLM